MIQTPDDPAYNAMRSLMRNKAVYRPTVASKPLQRPAGKSGRVTRYLPGTAEHDALLASRDRS